MDSIIRNILNATFYNLNNTCSYRGRETESRAKGKREENEGEEKERKSKCNSTKSQLVANGRKWSQTVANGRKRS